MKKATIEITRDYILEKYNLDEERQTVTEIINVGSLVPTKYDGNTVKVARKKICDDLDKFKKDDFIDIEFIGFDGDYAINIMRRVERLETNCDVIDRLQRQEKGKQQDQKDLERAAKLIREHGYYGAVPFKD
jgi:outer membrane protein assembly factor BamA